MKTVIINNFTIVLNNNKNAKITRIDSYINNGCMFETKNNCGISHLLEHVILDGWKKCGNSCMQYWKSKGVDINASTGQSYINYYISGLNKYHMEMLEYIISISLNPIIESSRVKKEKIAVMNELLINSSERNIDLYNTLNKNLFNNEGLQYQDDIDLQISNLKKISVSDLKNWAKKYYASGNIIFLVSGDFNTKTTISFLKTKLNSFKNFSRIEPPLNIFKPGIRVVYKKNTQIKNTTIFFTFHSPMSQKDKHIHLFHLLKKMINSDTTSLLMKKLREEEKLIYNIQLEHYIHSFGNYFVIEISTKNENIPKVIFYTIDVLKKITNGKFSNKYLNYTKDAFTVQYYNKCQNYDFFSSFIGEQYIHQIHNNENPTILSYKMVLELIQNVNRAIFINFVKKIFTFGNINIVYQGKRRIPNLPILVQQRI